MATKLSLNDFEVLGFLGKGAFGQVYLVRRLLTNDRYAMKVVKIYEGLDSKKIENIANENDIFRKISGEYLVKAAFSFSEGGLHMLFLEYMEEATCHIYSLMKSIWTRKQQSSTLLKLSWLLSICTS